MDVFCNDGLELLNLSLHAGSFMFLAFYQSLQRIDLLVR